MLVQSHKFKPNNTAKDWNTESFEFWTGKRNLFLQLCSDWCNSARGQRDRGSQGDHCQVVLQGLFVEVGVDRHPLDLPLDALALVAGRVLVQHNVNLGQSVICHHVSQFPQRTCSWKQVSRGNWRGPHHVKYTCLHACNVTHIDWEV